MPRVILVGSPPFAEPLRRGLVERDWLVGIITRPDRPRGRGLRRTPDPNWYSGPAPVWTPEAPEPEAAGKFLDSVRPDAAVVASYAKILPPWFLDLLPSARVNVHPSLLPKWRGPAPVPRTILAGDTETGVTLHRLEAGADTGEVFVQERIPLAGDERSGPLLLQLAEHGAALLLRFLPEIVAGTLPPHPQSTAGVSWAPKVRRSEGRVDWNRSAFELERAVRAFDPWPRVTAVIGGETVIIHELVLSGSIPNVRPGTVVLREGRPLVQTGEGAVELVRVQRAGRTVVSGREYASGLRERRVVRPGQNGGSSQ